MWPTKNKYFLFSTNIKNKYKKVELNIRYAASKKLLFVMI